MRELEHLQPTRCIRVSSSTRTADTVEGRRRKRERRIASRCSLRGRGFHEERDDNALSPPAQHLAPFSSRREREIDESKVSLARRACVRVGIGFPRGRGSPESRRRCVRSTDAGVHVDRARRSTSVGARPSCGRVFVCVRRRVHTTLIAANAGAPDTRV